MSGRGWVRGWLRSRSGATPPPVLRADRAVLNEAVVSAEGRHLGGALGRAPHTAGASRSPRRGASRSPRRGARGTRGPWPGHRPLHAAPRARAVLGVVVERPFALVVAATLRRLHVPCAIESCMVATSRPSAPLTPPASAPARRSRRRRSDAQACPRRGLVERTARVRGRGGRAGGGCVGGGVASRIARRRLARSDGSREVGARRARRGGRESSCSSLRSVPMAAQSVGHMTDLARITNRLTRSAPQVPAAACSMTINLTWVVTEPATIV